MENEVLLSIFCEAYNHEEFISQCLDGILSQHTTFHFEILIHDDASTDNTLKIIKQYVEKYPEVIKPIFQTQNQYSKQISIWKSIQHIRSKGKYIAFCEGDDYWTDPYKLQKQVDYMESHPNCGMVYTAYSQLNQNTKSMVRCESMQGTFKELIANNFIATCTVCLRKSIMDEYYKELFPKLPVLPFGDYQLWLYISLQSDIKYLNDDTSVYRVLEKSASHFGEDIDRMVKFTKGEFVCRNFFLTQITPTELYLLDAIKKGNRRKLFRIAIKSKDSSLFKDIYRLEREDRTLSSYRYFYLSVLRYLPFLLSIVRKFKRR